MSLRFLRISIATGFSIGYLPIAPATFACLISIIIWYFLLAYKILYIIVGIVLFILGIEISDSLSKLWGRDPKQIVIDEYAALLLPLYFTPKRIIPFIITFLSFRFFDIVKPPPLRKIENLPGGWGIMLDDLGAAIYTTIVVLVVNAINIL